MASLRRRSLSLRTCAQPTPLDEPFRPPVSSSVESTPETSITPSPETEPRFRDRPPERCREDVDQLVDHHPMSPVSPSHSSSSSLQSSSQRQTSSHIPPAQTPSHGTVEHDGQQSQSFAINS